ncbi:MAG: NADPH-dependent 7-cyano-7-deazaguanine reductase QueF [Gammaproteobacteria bacterium]|nr:NADPH-dependent 7-cyano-7-deazaguanine reductase QueF [Gammaproteobacteria bacterium]
MNDDLPLGRRVPYSGSYDPSVLRTSKRCTARQEIGMGDPLPFLGEDVWNCYELSWLAPSGLPRVGVLTLRVPVDSPRTVESKSLKLYLGGFSASKFEDSAAVRSTVEDDLSRETGSAVGAIVSDLDDIQRLRDFANFCLDHLAVSVDRYERSPDLLAATGETGRDAVPPHLFRSICPITGHPGWGSVAIADRGRLLDRASVLRYLVSYRGTADFHEVATERIFADLHRATDATELTVDARFLRRGGIDINPYRSTARSRAPMVRLPRQ